jgi:hypothetical protein
VHQKGYSDSWFFPLVEMRYLLVVRIRIKQRVAYRT